ncbi:sigma-70 family RNA polymerase sigma factor [Sinorhizobium meliloti]|uniref:sigma-70 family RNA polymerase sigma factor n=1 Tax=Rhizobium meliloti TaxID=382 RepID=UPI003B521786
MFNVSETFPDEALEAALVLRPKLLAIARRITKNTVAAEDVVQDVLLQLVSSPLKSDVIAPAHYLLRMVKNQAMDHVRRTKREQGIFVEDKAVGCSSGYGNPEECMRQCQAYSAIQKAIGAMSPRTRMFYERHYFDEVPQKVIARRQASLPLSSVASCERRIRAASMRLAPKIISCPHAREPQRSGTRRSTSDAGARRTRLRPHGRRTPGRQPRQSNDLPRNYDGIVGLVY